MVSGSRDSPFRPTVRCRSSRDCAGALGRVKASLAALAANAALTRPACSLWCGDYWSDAVVCACIPLRPRSAWLPARGERLACPRVSRWLMQEPPKFSHDLGQRFEVTRAISGGKRFPVHLGPSRPERSVHSARRSRTRAGACRDEASLLVRPRKRGVDCEQLASVQGLTHGCP